MTEWIEWHGGDRWAPPVPYGTIVEFECKDGYRGTREAETVLWDHDGDNGDVLRYRVVEDAE